MANPAVPQIIDKPRCATRVMARVLRPLVVKFYWYYWWHGAHFLDDGNPVTPLEVRALRF